MQHSNVPRLGSSACADGSPPSGNRRRSRLRNLQLFRHAQPTHGCLLSSGIRGGGAGGSAAGGSQPESLVAAPCAYFPHITRGRLARSVRPCGSPGPRGLSESSDAPPHQDATRLRNRGRPPLPPYSGPPPQRRPGLRELSVLPRAARVAALVLARRVHVDCWRGPTSCPPMKELSTPFVQALFGETWRS